MQSGEMELNPYTNQNALGALGPKIPSIAGQNMPGTTNNIMPQTGDRGPLAMHTPEHKKTKLISMLARTPKKVKLMQVKPLRSLVVG
jgi:hypothetical protein